MDREKLVSELRNKIDSVFDIIVIGGGATGLGIAVDAAARGYKTVLFEKADFASGTSSRSTKLVHGGVRYMAQGDLLLVIEALKERGRLLRNAPLLTKNQEFIIPVYTAWDVFLYTVGLKFYDLLAGRLSLGKSYYINKEKTIKRLPLIRQEGLRGGVVYHDGQFDDSRLAVMLAAKAIELGAITLNYFRVQSLVKNSAGRITGVEVVDGLSGSEYKISSKLVINACGVFADEVHRMDVPAAKPTIRPSQGVHIVLDRSFLVGDSAIMIPKTDDGRVLFAIPWYDEVVVGTTDTPLDSIEDEPKALDKEISFILSTAGRYLTKPPRREDIKSIFAGLRPLAAVSGDLKSTKEVSRRHKISLSGSGLLSIVGGKWTTYRCMAEEVIDRAIRDGIIWKSQCTTKNLRLTPDTDKVSSGRLAIYGRGAADIEEMIRNNPDSGKKMVPELPYRKAEIVWVIKNEMPCTVYDVLARRTRACLLNAKASLGMAPEVASLLASHLGKDKTWESQQLADYQKVILNYT